MAEGDSVYRMARRVEEAFNGRRIVAASAPNPRSTMRRTVDRLVGSELEAARTYGKHLVLDFDDGLSLHAHMGMSGGWYVYAPGQSWKRQRKSAWLIMDLGGLEVVQFGGPTLRLVRKIELNRDSRLALLGPDLLDPGFDPAVGTKAIATAGTIELGEALLDQKLVCGIGNIFKSESCWAAKMDPWRKVDSYSQEELEEVIGIAQKQLIHGAETGKRPQRIYKMAGRPCPRCRHRVKSRGQGLDNRTTYWCPNCQE